MIDVRTVRQTLDLNQTELANLLGLHQSTISRLESGSLEIDNRTRLALEALMSRPKAKRRQRAMTQ